MKNIFHLSDSEDEAPKKKVKAPGVGSKVKSPASVGGRSKVNSPSAVGGRKEIKSVTDFFGSGPVKRSPYFSGNKSASSTRKKEEV